MVVIDGLINFNKERKDGVDVVVVIAAHHEVYLFTKRSAGRRSNPP
jgi:hypothetical protein